MPDLLKKISKAYLINGVVQGVGFRPFIYRLATEIGLTGSVSNNSNGVEIIVEGNPQQIDIFELRLTKENPSVSSIDSIKKADITSENYSSFRILPSHHDENASTLISPDIALCDDCLTELFDKTDRRFRYPFINCTNCGPRYTIIESVPYDRPGTSMKQFDLCVDCQQEYDDPLDRRFHAQPNACSKCGPQLVVLDSNGSELSSDPIQTAVDFIRQGKIVAMRGIGGFHLVVDATNEEAVTRLRERKKRYEKPLAMMADLATIKELCSINETEQVQLTHYSNPIVLLQKKKNDRIAHSVAYDSPSFGFMLPYSPLHHLILKDNFRALVMTSGNKSEEPIAISNSDAINRLTNIADLFLIHDREILQRCDDSVVRVSSGSTQMIRRARGFVPFPVYLSKNVKQPILAVGGELKNTIALAAGKRVFLSQHIGDLDNPLALDFFEQTIEQLQSTLRIKPEAIACDMHPEYLSTKFAKAFALPLIEVQHHHAHLASVLADNQTEEPAIGIILDGTGYGADQTIWGGEILVGNAESYDRFAHLKPIALPGGSAAIKEPWRLAVSYLYSIYGESFSNLDIPLFKQINVEKCKTISGLIDKKINCPMTSSSGRLFDAVSALLGICTEATYEAKAAIMLEQIATTPELFDKKQDCLFQIEKGLIDSAPLIREIVRQLNDKIDIPQIANYFHKALADMFTQTAIEARSQTGINRVALSGGVYQNQLFENYLLDQLRREKFIVIRHKSVPPNDGGLSLGQVAVADAYIKAN